MPQLSRLPARLVGPAADQSDKKGSYLDGELRQVLGELYQPLMELRRDMQRSRLQAKLPYRLE